MEDIRTEEEAIESIEVEKDSKTRHQWLCKCNKFSYFKYTDKRFYYQGKERIKLKANEKVTTCEHCNKEHLIEVR